MRALIIEDVTVFHKFLEIMINQFGECDIVSNGEDGLKAYIKAVQDNKPYDFILLDIMMPGIGGMEVLKKIRSIDPNHEKVKIIMTTALSDSETVSAAIKNGCDGYLIKPYNREDIKTVLMKLKLL